MLRRATHQRLRRRRAAPGARQPARGRGSDLGRHAHGARRRARRAQGEPLRRLRDATLERARRFIALPYDELVADRLADLLAAARDQHRRAGAMDAIIAATALAHDLTVWSQDDDFDALAELAPELRVKRG